MTPQESATISLTGHLRILQARLSARSNESPEALLADLIPQLIIALAPTCGRPGVDLLGQAYEGDIGRPDFSVKQTSLLIGHVETKAPGAGADAERLRSAHDRSQWERFKNLPNLLYSDGTEFALYRSGERVGEVVRLSFSRDDRDQEASPEEATRLVSLLTDFLSWQAIAPASLAALADQLAPLCAVLRDAVRIQLDDRTSEVAKAAAEFESALFPGRSADEIADAFAQVCTYSMLLARAAGTTDLDARSVEDSLSGGHPVLGRIVRVLLDDFTERELGWALEPVRTLIEVIDFERLRRRGLLPGTTHHDQTWLYFYETFLARYDPKLRDQYGVYYTPQQVIHAQVALVEDLLQSRLGLPLGFAAPDVTVLDPAVGTGSYPIQVVLSAAERARENLGVAAVGGAVGNLAGNLFAFELLAGPYAVAHLRLAEVIEELGGGKPGESVNVYLTDTLSSPYAEPSQLTRLLEPLVDEQRQALRVKSDTRILVCLGNPPYERGRRTDEDGEAEGGWVVSGGGGGSEAIFEDFLQPLTDAGLGGYAKNLYNDYAYFWRWALWKVFEQPTGDGYPQPGIASFITASSYLAGKAFVGMREHMRRLCDEIWIIDLGGEGRGARREENVFAIQTPVAIAIAVRSKAPEPDEPATVHYARLTGTRTEKLDRLHALSTLSDLEWDICPDGWHDPFRPQASRSWAVMPAVTSMFPWQHSGVQVKRTWPIAAHRSTLEDRWNALLAADDRAAAMHETDARTVDATPAPLTGHDEVVPIASLVADSQVPPLIRYAYRPLDRHWLIGDNRLIDRPRPDLWRSMSERQVFMVSFLSGVLGDGPAAVATALVPDLDHFRGSFGGRHVIPLYRDAEGTPNVEPVVVELIGEALGKAISGEDLFAYVYCMLATPRYVERFFDELQQPGPRIPITADGASFDDAVTLGKELLWLHTYGQRMTDENHAHGAIPRGRARLKVEIPSAPDKFPESYAYDASSKTLHVGEGEIAPVEPNVWDWAVSGYGVVEGWLKYRLLHGAGRARRAASPLDAIRPATWPQEFTVELLELLWVLEATLALADEHAGLLDAVCDGPLVDVPPS